MDLRSVRNRNRRQTLREPGNSTYQGGKTVITATELIGKILKFENRNRYCRLPVHP
jgi:hypothetical protein